MVNETESVGKVKVYRAKTYAEWKLMYTESVPKLLARILQCLARSGKRLLNLLHPFRSSGVFYGGISELISEKLNETELLNRVIFYHGRVPQDELGSIRKNADIFVNFGNEHECGIPYKIFEYMSTGKRIISFKKIAHDASEPYLVRYGNALVLQEDYSKGEEYSKQILNFI